MAELTKEELDQIIADNKAIIASIKDPKKRAADKAIRDKAAAEGRALTLQELSQLSYRTGDEGRQVTLQELGAGPQGTPFNPFPTGEAAEKKPNNQAALNFAIYQNYLGNRDAYGGTEPMPFEEFVSVFEALGSDQNIVPSLKAFRKGMGQLAILTGGRQFPGMDLLLDPRYGATAEGLIASYNQQNPDNPIDIASGFSGETDGPYTTMGSPISGTSTGSSANIRNPYKVGTQQYEDFKDRRSAYDLLYAEFNSYGLGSLVEPLKGLIISAIPKDEFVLRLRETEDYKKRFAGNAERVAKGLAALSERNYIQLEDQYQNVMRNYGLPDTYWAKDALGTQEGFTKLIGNDVDSIELEDRIMNAQSRVINSNPEVSQALKQFYPEITNGDILAYALDPANGKEVIKRKITAAEIGGAAIQSGLQTGLTRAEELRAAGVTKDTAQQGFGTIAGGLQRGSQLASIYGEDPYTQTTAETEVFGLSGAQEARKQRQKVTGLEKATFGGQTGLTSGALVRDRAGGY
jgi:hypothetical protein